VKILTQLSLLAFVFVLVGCTTLANRRDLYFPQTVEGPYTRMLRDGIPAHEGGGTAADAAADFKSVR
jgi:hypothetical protein